MTDVSAPRTGNGPTPYAAAAACMPDRIEFADGLRGLEDRSEPRREAPFTHEVTVIDADRPPKLWRLRLDRTPEGWEATVVGSERV